MNSLFLMSRAPLLVFLLSTSVALAVAGLEPEIFKNPPAESRPMTWMHMMDGNASKAGLSKDLKALSDAGVGGALIFSIARNSGNGAVTFNSPEFRDILVHGVKEADRLGLKIGLHNCDGWSSSGGPWVTVEDSMKRVVWGETVVSDATVVPELPQPTSAKRFYREIAMIAMPATAAEQAVYDNPPTFTATNGDQPRLKEGSLNARIWVRAPKNSKEQPWLLISYDEPFAARSFYLEHGSRYGKATLYSSQDGEQFDEIMKFGPKQRMSKVTWIFESSFPEVKARYFKLVFDSDIGISQLDLAAAPRLPAWLTQTAMVRMQDEDMQRIDTPADYPFVPLNKIRMVKAGDSLPKGTWRIMRFGYTTTGAFNSPATKAGQGNECDKLDPAALDRHFAEYVGKVAEESGELAGKSLAFSEIDSYEMGGQHWTAGFEETFKAQKGYDLIPFLPLLAGRLIGDVDTADAVLGDFRDLVASMMMENYFGRFTELCNQYGMKSYIENYGMGPFNNLSVGGVTDIPMGEFWWNQGRGTEYVSPVSAAHTYGKPVISAESFTAGAEFNWKNHPYLMKEAGDYAWTQGINEFMFHRFAHQANTHAVPGMTMGSIGSHIDGTQTWWLNAGKAWMKYIQRGSYLLRQGVPVSDLLVYVGERAPNASPSREKVGLPAGYNMDLCDTKVLLERLRVEDQRLVLPEGTSYEMLLLYNTDQMSIDVLRRLYELSTAGATIIGPRPLAPIGYLERTTQQAKFTAMVDKLWGDGLITTGTTFPNDAIAPDFLIKEEPDAAYIHRRVGEDDLYFFHNTKDEAQAFNCSFRIADRIPELWYADSGKTERQAQFIQANGRTELPIQLEPFGSAFVVFRDSSSGVDAVKQVSNGGRVVLDAHNKMQLITNENGTYTVKSESGKKQQIRISSIQEPIIIEGAWRVEFDGVGLTGPKVLDFKTLTDWKDHKRDDIRHFSGTATYRKKMNVPRDRLKANKRIYLDLGRVEIAAEVIVNGQHAGILWKPPFVIDVTDQLKNGSNDIEIRVTNLWTNRLIGDESLKDTSGYTGKGNMPDWYINNEPMPAGPRSTFTTYNFYKKDRTLLPSGLLGPVMLFEEMIVPLKESK